MKNSADLGGCYPPRPSALVDNTLLDLHVVSATVANMDGMFVENIVKFVTEENVCQGVEESRVQCWF